MLRRVAAKTCAYVAAGCLAAGLAGAPVARADGVGAADLDRRGRAAFVAGRDAEDKRNAAEATRLFDEAARAFEEADRIAPHPQTKFNAATAREKAGDLPRAADAFEAALATGLAGELAETARAHLAALSPKLGVIEVALTPSLVTFAHVARAHTPLRAHVGPGGYDVSFEPAAGPPLRVHVEVQAGAVAVVPAPTPPALPAPRPSPERDGGCPLCIAGWVSFGSAALLAATAVGLGVAAIDARDDFVAGGNVDAGERDRALTLETTTNVVWAGAGAAAVASVVLLAVGYSTHDSPVSGRGLVLRF